MFVMEPHDMGDGCGIRGREIRGLVLYETGNARGEVQRFGTFMMLDVPDDERIKFNRTLRTHGAEIARAICAEEVDNPEYPDEPFVLTIV